MKRSVNFTGTRATTARRAANDPIARGFIAAMNERNELLAALRELVRAWDARQLPVSDRMQAALDAAEAAIAKAEGAAPKETA